MLSAECGFSIGLNITPSIGTLKAGDVLTCDSDGQFYDDTYEDFQTNYTWSGTTGIDTDNEDNFAYSPNPFTLPEGPFVLTCTAIVDERSCMKTITIMDTAYSKYHKTQFSTSVSNSVR